MSEQIGVGDLVVVIRPHCCDCDVGDIYRVAAIKEALAGFWTCMKCHKRHLSKPVFWADGGDGLGTPLHCLKRIPPIEELEGEKQKEDLREPA